MQINFSCFGRQIYINVIPYERPYWLTRLLFPLYWKWLPWAKEAPLIEGFPSDELLYAWTPVETLVGKAGYEYRWHEGKLYTRVYNA